MKNLNRSRNQVSPQQVEYFNQGRILQENEDLRKQVDHAWQQFEAVNAQGEELQKAVEEATAIAHREQQEKQTLMQRLQDAIASRNSMRGRLGNMTAQRNKMFQALKTNIDRLTEAHQRISQLQQEYDSDMAEFARVYREITPEQRRALPPKLRRLLEQVARDYRE
ncbi:hypothetical protein H6G89_28275 [Oscillatoria sp. FACHB-1407]|uniref:hypothetical protein n=1 Tax=Oscillatoria sp. FACHB-1407 TaxID=2692847 RepID=UPI001683E827|nr:hypothetical protein [Oscillatoria sp. FACHB-1407]MBD2464905.1 hypothetical protein [Oscillatoria sp. FACHB-1407]